MVSVFLGKWENTSSENFDEFLKAVGFASPTSPPTTPSTVKSTLEFSESDGKIIHTSVGSKGVIGLSYELGNEFEEPLPHDDNIKAKNVVTLEDGKLVHKVSIGPKEILTTHEVNGEELVVKYESGSVVGVRKFKKIA